MNKKLISVTIPGYSGLWTEYKSELYFGTRYYLMYNDQYGCKLFRLVVTEDFSQIYETYKSIKECLKEENILI